MANTEPPVALTVPPRAERVAGELRELIAYGPILVTTRAEGIPEGDGITRDAPKPDDPDRRPITKIEHSALTITDEEDKLQLVANTAEGPIELPLDSLYGAGIDHPHGEFMPITGKGFLRLTLTVSGSQVRPLVTSRERGWFDRVESSIDSADPSVGAVLGYHVTGRAIETTTLDQAKQLGGNAMLFFVSRVLTEQGDLSVVTSRLRHSHDSDVAVGRDHSIDMQDVAGIQRESTVLERHLERVARLAEGSPSGALQLRLMDVDEVFLRVYLAR